MSNRPAEHSDGDRSTRNAAHGSENMRFRAIRGALEPKPFFARRFRVPGRLQRHHRRRTYTPRGRTRPARHQRPDPCPRRGPRESAFGRVRARARLRNFAAQPETPRGPRLQASKHASERKRFQSRRRRPPDGHGERFRGFFDRRVGARARLLRSQGAGQGRLIRRAQRCEQVRGTGAGARMRTRRSAARVTALHCGETRVIRLHCNNIAK